MDFLVNGYLVFRKMTNPRAIILTAHPTRLISDQAILKINLSRIYEMMILEVEMIATSVGFPNSIALVIECIDR